MVFNRKGFFLNLEESATAPATIAPVAPNRQEKQRAVSRPRLTQSPAIPVVAGLQQGQQRAQTDASRPGAYHR